MDQDQLNSKTKKPGKEPKFEKIEPGLYRYKPSGVYYIVLKKDGKTKWKNLETSDKPTARRLLAADRDAHEVLDSNLSGLELDELTVRYLETINNKAPKTLQTRKGVIKLLLKGIPAKTKVRELKPSKLASWAAGLDVSEVTFNEYIRIVRDIFKLAVDDKIILSNPSTGLKRRKVPAKRKLTPTWEQFKSIVEDIRSNPHDPDSNDSADFVEFMGSVGLGQAEARYLRVVDVNWERNRISARRQKTGKAFSVPIYPQAKALVRRLYDAAVKNRRPGEPENPNERRLLKIDDAKKAFTSSCKRLGYSHFTQRSLRRCFITRAIEKGIDFKTIAETQGHSDGGVLVAKTYSYLRENHLDSMADKLE